MHRFTLLLGLGTSLIASGGCGGDRRQLTPLMRAARVGDVDTINDLLEHGADPNAAEPGNGWTPLIHAIHKAQTAAVRTLLEHGGDPNRAAAAMRPLAMAAAEPDPAMVQLLLAHGADPHARGA